MRSQISAQAQSLMMPPPIPQTNPGENHRVTEKWLGVRSHPFMTVSDRNTK
ncbi:MAG: hypothetical protein AAGA83_05560 [Cyanobacteria bacterium P01_F01_bin.116]